MGSFPGAGDPQGESERLAEFSPGREDTEGCARQGQGKGAASSEDRARRLLQAEAWKEAREGASQAGGTAELGVTGSVERQGAEEGLGWVSGLGRLSRLQDGHG